MSTRIYNLFLIIMTVLMILAVHYYAGLVGEYELALSQANQALSQTIAAFEQLYMQCSQGGGGFQA